VLTLDGVAPPPRRGGAQRAVGFVRPYLFGLVSAAYLFAIGWIRSRNRGFIVQLCRHFGYTYDVRERPVVAMVALDEVTDEKTQIDIRAFDSVDGNVTDRELVALCRLVRESGPRTIFEFGTFDGRTTLNLAANSPAGATVFTLDLPAEESDRSAVPLHSHELRYAMKPESGSRFKGSDLADRIDQLYGDSATIDLSKQAGAIDFVFIDASHVYEYVINDSLKALGMLRDGRGVIVWHDYSRWDGVTRAVNDLRQRHPSFREIRWIEGTTLALLKL
jgi:predicted O-methyltransferase YrrM